MLRIKIKTFDTRHEPLQCTDTFYFVADVVGVESGVITSSLVPVRSGWKESGELVLVLTVGGLSLLMKYILHASCVRKCDDLSSKIWALVMPRYCRALKREW